MSNVEMLDLVDENNVVYDTRPRSEIYAKHLDYVRTIDALIVGNDGRLWIPLRTDDKVIFPNAFDVGVGGHIEHGMTDDETFRKEFQKEVGWDIDDFKWEKIGTYGPPDGFGTWSTIYIVHSDEDPVFNPEDFKSAERLSMDEIMTRIAGGQAAKDNLPLIITKFLMPTTQSKS